MVIGLSIMFISETSLTYCFKSQSNYDNYVLHFLDKTITFLEIITEREALRTAGGISFVSEKGRYHHDRGT